MRIIRYKGKTPEENSQGKYIFIKEVEDNNDLKRVHTVAFNSLDEVGQVLFDKELTLAKSNLKIAELKWEDWRRIGNHNKVKGYEEHIANLKERVRCLTNLDEDCFGLHS